MSDSLSAEEILERIPEEALPCEKYINRGKVDDFECVGQLEAFLLKNFIASDQIVYSEFISDLVEMVKSDDFEYTPFYLTDGSRTIYYMIYKLEEGYGLYYVEKFPVMN